MHIREIDWRTEPLHDITIGIDAALAAVKERLGGENIDGLTALCQMEPILGLGFVAFQNYALGTWTDLNAIRKRARKHPVDKLE
jgi:hypothetical protein